MIALWMGFGFSWILSTFVGRRLPRTDVGPGELDAEHFPITLPIAAAGAATVSLIEHAHHASTPSSMAWLPAGAVALGLLALIVIERALVDAERLPVIRLPTSQPGHGRGAAAALVVDLVSPAPWHLALPLVAILDTRLFAVSGFLRGRLGRRAVSRRMTCPLDR